MPGWCRNWTDLKGLKQSTCTCIYIYIVYSCNVCAIATIPKHNTSQYHGFCRYHILLIHLLYWNTMFVWLPRCRLTHKDQIIANHAWFGLRVSIFTIICPTNGDNRQTRFKRRGGRPEKQAFQSGKSPVSSTGDAPKGLTQFDLQLELLNWPLGWCWKLDSS